jgi:HlyD family secretion protein
VSNETFSELGQRRKHAGWYVVAALLLIAGVAFVVMRGRAKPRSTEYVTGTVTQGDVQETVETSGTVQPLVQVQVGSQVSGRITRVHVDFNHRVRAGQLLAEIDATPFRAAVAQARAQVMAATAQLQRARANERLTATNLQRAQELRARALNAQSEVDQARGAHDVALADVAVSNAEIARGRAALNSAETNLGCTRIVSPIDGIVIQRSVDEGQTVAASFQAPVLFLLAGDLARMRIVANIDEADIARMREQLVAEARVDAFQGEVFRGIVSEVRYGAVTTAGVVTYPAVITIDNAALKLRPGMTATITVTSNRHQNVLRVPNAALRYRPGAFSEGGDAGVRERTRGVSDDTRRRVFVLRNGRPTPVEVRVGIVDDSLTEVSGEGLSAGQQVITDEIDTAPQRPGAGGSPGAMSGGGRRGPR